MDTQTDGDARAGLERFSLRAALAEAIDALRGPLASARVEVTTHVPDWVPDALAGDRAGLGRILAGVIGLGISDAPGGVISLDVATASETGGRVVLRFSVTDSGAGAPDDGRRQGVAALVEAMGGRLSIESAAGAGSTVQFTLPLVLAGAGTKPVAVSAGGVGMEERSGTGTGSGSGSGSGTGTDGKVAGGSRRGPLWAAAALAAYGVGAAAYLLYAKIRIKFDASFASACDFGGKLNCDAVQTSPYSEVLGVPVALLAIPTYAMMAFLALAAARSRDADPQAAGRSVGALFGLGALTTCYAVYLAWLSAFVIKAFCIFCISMYVVQLAVAILAWRASPGGLRALVRSAADAALTFAWPMPLAAIVFSVALGASAVGFHYTKGAVLSRSLAALAEPEPVAVAPAVKPAAPSPALPAAQAPRAAAPAMSTGPSGAVDIPVGPGDYVGGNPSSAVTLVDFADFQCSYCRVLASEMTRLKSKYGAQVRFVFKHYPMNSDCNPGMSAEKPHEHACTAARAAHCAGEQGKFWEMHDRLYQGQDSLGEALYSKLAADLGLDAARFRQCLSDPKTERKIREDVALGRRLDLNSTPSVFINGRIVRGLAAEILDYHIQLALKQPKLEFAAVEAALPKPDHPSMVQARTAKGTFFIDAFEASIGPDGRALSLAAATPAQFSWFEARDACAKAGKRLCTEEEWVSACAGEPAVDNNGNGYFADDEVEGRMYPYGMLYERGRCRDDEDKYQGEPGLTGVRPGCRTPDGIYDLAGNLGEWVGAEQPRATVTGGDYRGGERSACNRRSATFGPGIRNNTIGFRCCADAMVEQPRVAASEVDTSSTLDVVGRPVPAFEIPPVDGQGMIASQDFRKNRLTYLTFFASWCGPCKRELPELKRFVDTYGPKGFRVVAVGEDRVADTSKTFAAQYQPNYPVAHDPDNVLMGRFGVDAMPASFLIDRKGAVRFRHEGFKPEEIPGIVAEIERLLAE